MNLRLALGLTVGIAGCIASTTTTTTPNPAATSDGAVVDAGDEADILPADFRACDGPGECAVAATGCCNGATGVNAKYVSAYRRSVCPEGPPPCPPPAYGSASIVAACRASTCTAVDIRTDGLSDCETDDDCMLRLPTCCSCGDVLPDRAIAIAKSKEDEFRAEICSGKESCPACTPTFESYRVACDPATKHCRAIVLLPDGGDRPF
jgi:hypothetical protein